MTSPRPGAAPPLELRFPGGKQVIAAMEGFEIATDQPVEAGGSNRAPSPFDLFLASMATCAGYYVLEFCEQRGIPVAGIRMTQTFERDPRTRRLIAVRQEIELPPGFPTKYAQAIARAAETCSVKRTLEQPPPVTVRVRDSAPVGDRIGNP